MKLNYILFFLLFSLFLNAQEDLNRTWFLTELTVEGNAVLIPNEEFQDGYPTLAISINDAEGQVEGIGICNGFISDELLAPVSATDTMITLNISPSLAICDTGEEINFEAAYFNFLGAPESENFNYTITELGDFSLGLTITKSNGDTAVYNSINQNPPQNLTQESWFLDYFEIDGVAQNYPAQQDGQLNNFIISHFDSEAAINQEYLCFYGSAGFYSAYNYFGAPTISTTPFGFLAMDCGIESLNDYDDTFATQLENKIFTYEIIEEDQGRRLILTDGNGDRIFYTNAFLGAEEFDQVSIELFPNPSSDKLTITGEHIDRIQSYQIVDIQGRIVSQNTFNTIINVESLATGMYFLKLQGIQTKTIHRFIKK